MGLDAVEEVFIRLKNTTELMVDLAYSALLYENREIAEEVMDLEELVDAMHMDLIQRFLESVPDGTNPEAVLAVARLAISLEIIADAAQEIASVVLKGIELHPVVKMSIEDSDVTITRVEIFDSSVLAGKTLGELHLSTETGMWVFAIKRGKDWIYGPTENDRLMVGDVVFARGSRRAAEQLQKIATGVEGL